MSSHKTSFRNLRRTGVQKTDMHTDICSFKFSYRSAEAICMLLCGWGKLALLSSAQQACSSSSEQRAPALTLTTEVQDSVKVLAKSLVRNRQYVTKMHQTKANLQAVSLKITVCPAYCTVWHSNPVPPYGTHREHVRLWHADSEVHRSDGKGHVRSNQGARSSFCCNA